MAITEIEYLLFRNLRQQGVLKTDADILELGEANWYGDVGLNNLTGDIARFAPEADREALTRELDEIVAARRPHFLFELAKVYWRAFLQPRSMTAIDFHGTDAALKLNLNDPLDLGRQFDVVMNLGTTEHVFNVAQAFKTIHDHVRPGGLMIHGLPFTGWVDHGFYSFHPTFYWDLAAANDYQVVLAVCSELKPVKLVRVQAREEVLKMAEAGQIGVNALMYVVLRAPTVAAPFRIPMQGYYARSVSGEAAKAWTGLR